jgi:hypothetical protein
MQQAAQISASDLTFRARACRPETLHRRHRQQPCELPLPTWPLQNGQQELLQEQAPRRQRHSRTPHTTSPVSAQQSSLRDPVEFSLCSLDAPLLTKRLHTADSWGTAAVLFANSAGCANVIHLAALLSRLASMRTPQGSRPANWRALVARVLEVSLQQLGAAAPRQLSTMAAALASLGFHDWVMCADDTGGADGAAAWGAQWRCCLLASLPRASCRDISSVLWALATSATCARVSGAAVAAAALSVRCGACRRPPLVLEPQHNLLYDSRLSQELCSALQRTLPGGCPQDVANALWALASLQLMPPPELRTALLARVQELGSSMSPLDAGMVVWATARLRLAPPPAWLDELLLRQLAQPGWAAAPPRPTVMCLVACAVLRHRPPVRWLRSVLHLLHDDLQLLPQLLAPPHDGAAAAADDSSNSSSSNSSSSRSVSRHSSQDLANTLWALAVLGVRPHAPWMSSFLLASAAAAPTASPQELTNTLWALARLRTAPDAAWLAAFDAASVGALQQFSAQGLADALAAQVHLGLVPSAAWGAAWTTAVRACWGSADVRARVKILWAASRCRLPLGRRWLRAALPEACRELTGALARGELSAVELLRLLWAAGRLCRGDAMTHELADDLALHACRAAPAMSYAHIESCARSLSHLQPAPVHRLRVWFCELAALRLRGAPPEVRARAAGQLRLLAHEAAIEGASDITCTHNDESGHVAGIWEAEVAVMQPA